MVWKRAFLVAVTLLALALTAGSQVYADAWPSSPVTTQPNDSQGPGVTP